MTRSTRVRAVCAALLFTLVLAGCGSDPEEQEEGKAGGGTWPYTGLPVQGGESARTPHPPLVVKIDNTTSSEPQVGLGSADLVVEEPVEGGESRLAAFYHSDLPKEVGPVRSVRASDIGIVSGTEAVMVTSGGAPQTLARLKKSQIELISEGGAGFFRESGRQAPYDLFNRLGETAEKAKQDPARPDDYLPWGEAGDLPQGRPAKSFSASFGTRTSEWAFQGGHYVNKNGFAAKGDEFPADTVLALTVALGDAGYKDPAGNPVPEAKLTGRGQALLFHDGRVVKGTWAKKSEGALELTAGGETLTVPAGKTWVELVPKGSGGVTFGG